MAGDNTKKLDMDIPLTRGSKMYLPSMTSRSMDRRYRCNRQNICKCVTNREGSVVTQCRECYYV